MHPIMHTGLNSHARTDGRRAMTSQDRTVLPAISATLRELDLADVDQGAAQLAVRIAQQLDDAQWAERVADKVLRKIVDEAVWPDETITAMEAVKAKLAARVAVSDLAPKLTAVLMELGGTPMSRAKLAKLTPKTDAPPDTGWLTAMQGGQRGA
jgi:hypothetical protein